MEANERNLVATSRNAEDTPKQQVAARTTLLVGSTLVDTILYSDYIQKLDPRALDSSQYRYERRKGDMVQDKTAFLLCQQDWGVDRECRPPILFRFHRPANQVSTDPGYFFTPSPTAAFPVLKVVIDDITEEPLLNFPDVPIIISTKVEGWLMEAWLRLNPELTYDDIIQRMPYQDRNAKGLKNKLSARRRDFRQYGRCISWEENTAHSSPFDKRILEEVCANAEWMAADTTRYLRDLTKEEKNQLEAASRDVNLKRKRARGGVARGTSSGIASSPQGGLDTPTTATSDMPSHPETADEGQMSDEGRGKRRRTDAGPSSLLNFGYTGLGVGDIDFEGMFRSGGNPQLDTSQILPRRTPWSHQGPGGNPFAAWGGPYTDPVSSWNPELSAGSTASGGTPWSYGGPVQAGVRHDLGSAFTALLGTDRHHLRDFQSNSMSSATPSSPKAPPETLKTGHDLINWLAQRGIFYTPNYRFPPFNIDLTDSRSLVPTTAEERRQLFLALYPVVAHLSRHHRERKFTVDLKNSYGDAYNELQDQFVHAMFLNTENTELNQFEQCLNPLPAWTGPISEYDVNMIPVGRAGDVQRREMDKINEAPYLLHDEFEEKARRQGILDEQRVLQWPGKIVVQAAWDAAELEWTVQLLDFELEERRDEGSG